MENININPSKSTMKINIEKELGNREFDGIGLLEKTLDSLLYHRNNFYNPRNLDFDISNLEVDSLGKVIFKSTDTINTEFDIKLFQFIEMILISEKIKVRTLEKKINQYIEFQQYHKLKAMISTLRYDKVPMKILKVEAIDNELIPKKEVAFGGRANRKSEKFKNIDKLSLKSCGKIELFTTIITIVLFLILIVLRLNGMVFTYTVHSIIVLLTVNVIVYLKGNKSGKKVKGQQLYVLISKDYKSKYYLNQGNNFFGRSSEYSDHVVDGKSIGRRHANLVVSGENIFVRDLNSMNGTFVNEKPLTSIEVALYENDTIRFANKEYILLRN